MHLLGHARGVLGDLGERHVRGLEAEPGPDQLGLEGAQAPEVLAQYHEGDVRLVPEQPRRDDLVALIAGALHRLGERRPVHLRGNRGEEVEDRPSLGHHEGRRRATVWRAHRESV